MSTQPLPIMSAIPESTLYPALEELVLARFDSLLAWGEILYELPWIDTISAGNSILLRIGLSSIYQQRVT